jgi:hypothetical protein
MLQQCVPEGAIILRVGNCFDLPISVIARSKIKKIEPMINTKLTFLFIFLFITEFVWAQKGDNKPDIKGDMIYLLEQKSESDKIKIGLIKKQDGTRYFIDTRVMKNGPFRYIKINGDSYYLDCDAAPTMESDICNDFRKIQPDTTVKFGEALARGIIVAILIDQNGEIVTSGIATSANDEYYDNKTLQLLKTYNKDKNVPASLRGRPISYLLMVSTIFHQGKCQIVHNWN